MSVHNVASRSSEKLLFFGFLVLARSVLCHGFAEEFTPGSYDFGSVILEPLDGLRKYVESIVGTHVIAICTEVTFFVICENISWLIFHFPLEYIAHKYSIEVALPWFTYLTEVLIIFHWSINFTSDVSPNENTKMQGLMSINRHVWVHIEIMIAELGALVNLSTH